MCHGFTITPSSTSLIAMATDDSEEESHHNGRGEDVDVDGMLLRAQKVR